MASVPPLITAEVPSPEFTAVLTRWRAPDGAHVNVGDIICELDTELATVDFETFQPGILRHLKREGDTVRRGDAIARIEPRSGDKR